MASAPIPCFSKLIDERRVADGAGGLGQTVLTAPIRLSPATVVIPVVIVTRVFIFGPVVISFRMVVTAVVSAFALIIVFCVIVAGVVIHVSLLGAAHE